MKSNLYLSILLIFSLFLLNISCSKDDAPPPPEEEEKEENPDNPDSTVDPNQDPVESVDYLALKALYEANDGNTLGWDLADATMQSWVGVEQENERVTELKIDEKGIKTLVPEIGNLEKLRLLDVSKNELNLLPQELKQLNELKQLFLRENSLVELPENGFPLVLETLGLAENKLTGLPFSFQNLVNLEILNLSGNFYEVIPKEMGAFSKMRILDYSNNLIEEVPKELGQLYGLEYLGLEENDFSIIPQEVCNLDEFGNTEIAKDRNVTCNLLFYQYEGLKALYQANPNNTLNWDLNDLTMQSWQGLIFDVDGSLLSISLTGFGLSVIPPEIGNLRHLFAIILRNNGISELPPQMGLLTELRELFLENNSLTALPESIGNLENLYWMTLKNNLLESIPDSMGNMGDIEILNLSDNQLTEVPVTLANLEPTINELHLTANRIIELPPEICGMQSLNIEAGICP